ncbi:periplasmic trehalase [Escherichia coli]|uniref:Periplasmic trehalase n=1 Tax=Escherichia coli TaxID=562 RepID=A0A377D1F4_ECOLX|nr:periplasmic trehalase [Escherichia coli]
MDISWHFLTNVQHTYDREKKLVEKYDVSTTGTGGGGGEYPLQDGFGWTNGVTLKMLDLICPKEQPCDNVPATRPTVKSATTQPSPRGTTHTLTSAYSDNVIRLLRMALSADNTIAMVFSTQTVFQVLAGSIAQMFAIRGCRR